MLCTVHRAVGTEIGIEIERRGTCCSSIVGEIYIKARFNALLHTILLYTNTFVLTLVSELFERSRSANFWIVDHQHVAKVIEESLSKTLYCVPSSSRLKGTYHDMRAFYTIISLATIMLISPSNAHQTSQTNTVPAPTTTVTSRRCLNTSVEGDATYCVDGPICSGSGEKPAGTNCPKAGYIAISDCNKSLKSYYATAGKCVIRTDTVCKKSPKSGAWGCTYNTTTSTACTSSNSTTLPAGSGSGARAGPASVSLKGSPDFISQHSTNPSSTAPYVVIAIAIGAIGSAVGAMTYRRRAIENRFDLTPAMDTSLTLTPMPLPSPSTPRSQLK